MHEIHDTALLGLLARSPEILVPKTDDVAVSIDGERDRGEAVAELERQLTQRTNSYSLSIALLTGSLTHVEGTFAVFATDWQLDDLDYYAGAGKTGERFYRDVIQGGPHDSYADRLTPFIDPDVTVLEPGIETTEWGEPTPPANHLTVGRPRDIAESGALRMEGPEVWPVTFARETSDPTVRFFERVPFREPLRTVDNLRRELEELMKSTPYWDNILPRAEQAGREIVDEGRLVSSLHAEHPDYVYREAKE